MPEGFIIKSGFRGLLAADGSTSQAFEKVFREVVSVTESVSSRSDVERLPIVDETLEVSRDNFGRFRLADRGVVQLL